MGQGLEELTAPSQAEGRKEDCCARLLDCAAHYSFVAQPRIRELATLPAPLFPLNRTTYALGAWLDVLANTTCTDNHGTVDGCWDNFQELPLPDPSEMLGETLDGLD